MLKTESELYQRHLQHDHFISLKLHPRRRPETWLLFLLIPPASSASLPQSESSAHQFSAANSSTVFAPLELICHQFLFLSTKLFLEAEIGPIPVSTTFHYSQELNTWWPLLSSWLPYQVKAFFLSMRIFFFFYFLQPTVEKLRLHNHLSHNDINQSQSGFSPLKLHANLGLNEPHLCMILSPALWLHWSS